MRVEIDVTTKSFDVEDSMDPVEDAKDDDPYKCSSSACEFESVTVRETFHDYARFEVEAQPNEKVFVLIEHYRDGGTFGDWEQMEARGVYPDYKAAYDASVDMAPNSGYFSTFLDWKIEEATITPAERPQITNLLGCVVESVWFRPGTGGRREGKNDSVAFIMQDGAVVLWEEVTVGSVVMPDNFKGPITDVKVDRPRTVPSPHKYLLAFVFQIHTKDAVLELESTTNAISVPKLTPKKGWVEVSGHPSEHGGAVPNLG